MNGKKEIPSAEKAPVTSDTDRDLKAAREARGLSLSDVFQTTRVSALNLQALENGNFRALPPPVYTRSFIRKYARAVGVDEKLLLKRYETYLEGKNLPREDPGVQKPWPEASRRYRFLFGSLAVVIIAGILVYALILYDQSVGTIPPAQPVESPPTEQVKPEPAVTEPVTPAEPTATDSTPTRRKETTPPPAPATALESAPAAGKPVIPPPVAASEKTLHLVIEARESSWLRITEGRNPSYQVLLKPGEKIERAASDFFLLDIGNAGGVNLIFEGKPLGSLGKQGQVIHLRLPEKTAEKETP